MGTSNDDRHTDIIFTTSDNTTASPLESASMLLHQYSLPSLRPPPSYNDNVEEELLSSINQRISSIEFDSLNLPLHSATWFGDFTIKSMKYDR